MNIENIYICLLNTKLTNMKKLFLIAIAAMTFSCSSDDGPSNVTPDPQASGYAFMRGKMNNVDFDYTVNNTATDVFIYSPIGGYSGLDNKLWYRYGASISSFTPPNFIPEIMIGWDNVYYYSGVGADLENEQFYTTVGNLPTNFLTDNQSDNYSPGVTVDFRDAQGKFYSTIYGSQSGSSVAVTGSSQAVEMGIKTKTVWGTFSCKMYNENNPADVKQITNGTFKVVLFPNN